MATEAEFTEKFYGTVKMGKRGPLGDIWSHSATVTTMHPSKVSRTTCRKSWEQVAQ